MKVCTQLDLNCICCEEMNRENRIKFLYQDIAFGKFDAILLIFMSSVVTPQMNIEKNCIFTKKTHKEQ